MKTRPPRVRYASRAAPGPPEKAMNITATPARTKGTKTIRTSIEGATIPATTDGERGHDTAAVRSVRGCGYAVPAAARRARFQLP